MMRLRPHLTVLPAWYPADYHAPGKVGTWPQFPPWYRQDPKCSFFYDHFYGFSGICRLLLFNHSFHSAVPPSLLRAWLTPTSHSFSPDSFTYILSPLTGRLQEHPLSLNESGGFFSFGKVLLPSVSWLASKVLHVSWPRHKCYCWLPGGWSPSGTESEIMTKKTSWHFGIISHHIKEWIFYF